MTKIVKNYYLFIFLILLSVVCIDKSHASKLENNQTSYKILSDNDVKLYSEIFNLQKKMIKNRKSNIWIKIEKIKSKISNKLLFGHLLADKYLHPTGWRSKYNELKTWLDKYNDHPDAYRIYRLAKRRQPQKVKSPKKPIGEFLNGYGNISNDLIKPKIPFISKGNKHRKYANRLSIQFRRSINKRKISHAQNLLNNKKNQSYLSIEEIAQLRAELSHANFIFKNDFESLRQARVSISLSNSKNALAYWAGGLASWRTKQIKQSKWFFNNLCKLNQGPESIISGGCFWSARLAFETQDIKKINNYLIKASSFERTFYSTLAKASLGYKEKLDFSLPKITKTFVSKIKSFKGGKRLLALIQISENHRAEREFRKIISNFSIKEYPKVISFAAANNLPGLAFRISAILRNDHGLIYLGGLYPLPNWNIDKAYVKDKALIYSISRQESGFNPRAKSSANALGLMQVLPSTAAFIMKNRSYRFKSKRDILYNAEKNIIIGTKYIKFLLSLDLVDNNVIKMLASYNAGPGNFKKWTSEKKYLKNSDILLLIETLPARQTRNYIKLVLTNLWIYRFRLNEVPYLIPALASGNEIKFIKR